MPRCWREIDYVFMLGEVIRRYGLTFERRHITALSRQLLDEAEHYDAVARIVERLGGRVPVAAAAVGGRVEPRSCGTASTAIAWARSPPGT